MWKNKNFRLLVVLVILMIVTGIQLFQSNSSDRVEVDRNLFSVQDTLGIEEVRISYNGQNVLLKNEPLGWTLNESAKADDYYVSLLKAVLASVEVQREVSVSEIQQLEGLTDQNEAKVTIKMVDGVSWSFYASGNETQTLSYFKGSETNNLFVVNIPGYRSFVSGIFMLSDLEWKDKTLFTTPWTSLQSLKVNYPANPEWDFEIIQDKGFLKMPGVNSLDTLRMMDYVGIFSALKANYFFENDVISNISDRVPFMEIAVEDLDTLKNNRIRIFPLAEGSTIQLGVDASGQIFGFDYRNVNILAHSIQEFSITDDRVNP